MSKSHSSLLKGKRAEYKILTKLLTYGFDVYIPVVDENQIDCVLRHEIRGDVSYLELQIKARSKDISLGDRGDFSCIKLGKVHKNYYLIFLSELDETEGIYWVIPSLVFKKLANEITKGKDKGKWWIRLAGKKEKRLVPRPKYKNYEGFEQLKKWSRGDV